MMLLVLKRHQVHDVDDAHSEVRSKLAKNLYRTQRFEGRHVAGTNHDLTRFGRLSVEAKSQMLTPARQ